MSVGVPAGQLVVGGIINHNQALFGRIVIHDKTFLPLRWLAKISLVHTSYNIITRFLHRHLWWCCAELTCHICPSPAELLLQTDDGWQQVREVLQGSAWPDERGSDGNQSHSVCERWRDDAQSQREGAGERWGPASKSKPIRNICCCSKFVVHCLFIGFTFPSIVC